MEQNKCKYAKDGKCTNPNAEAIDCPTETYDTDSAYSDCDWFENDSEFNQPINGGLLNLAKVAEQLIQHDTDNCDITYKHGNMEIVFNFCITKISQNGEVVYDAGEEDADS